MPESDSDSSQSGWTAGSDEVEAPEPSFDGWLRRLSRLRELTDCGRECPAKALLADLSPDPEELLSGRKVYADYFERFLFVDETVCVPSLASAVEQSSSSDPRRAKILDDLFKVAQPREEPAFFSFSSRRDLARLAETTGQDFVVYFVDLHRKQLTPFYDPRCVSYDPRPRYRDCYVWTCENRLYSTAGPSARAPVPKFPLDKYFSCQPNGPHFVSPLSGVFASSLSPRGWLGALEKALLGEEVAAGLPPLDEQRDGELLRLRGPGFLQGTRSLLWRRWTTPAIVCAFVGLEKSPPRGGGPLRRALVSRVALSSFQTVVHVRPDGESPETSLQNNPATPVICLFAGSCVARLSEPFAECVRRRAAGLSSEKDRLSNGGLTACWGDPVKKATPAERESAFRLLKAKRQSARSARLDATEKRCRCSISCGREDFDDNMSRAGPERLMSGRYCARDLVNMLGASELLAPAPGSPFSDILEEACNLCIASMDLESRTVPVATSSAFSPFPDAEDETEEEEDVGRFFGPRRTLDTRFVQKPIMLAHADALTADLPPSDPGRCFLTVSDDSESAVFDMFSAYWDYVLHSQ